MSGYQRIVNRHGVPVQQSMTVNPADYTGLNLTRPMLGIILEVFPADDQKNRSSMQREDRRGYLHTATVLVIQDGRDTYCPIENVIITPDAVSGLNDYYERLPKGCSSLITGESFNNQLNHINPYDLNGDWCVISFIGGCIDQPFILRWWPHPWNAYDPATSGQTNPNAPGQTNTLIQRDRYFHRINDVEFVVTKTGNVYLSTYRANSSLNYGIPVTPVEGRFPRTLDDENGGSLKVWIKPSQSLELDWNAPIDGIGVEDMGDPDLPQTNPSQNTTSNGAKENTYAKVLKNRIDITVPEEINITSHERILLTSDEESRLSVGTDLTITAGNDISMSADSNFSLDVSQQTDITSTGPLSVQSDVTVTVNAGSTLGLAGSSVAISAAGGNPAGSIGVNASSISLGTGVLGGVVGGTPLSAAFAAFQVAVQAAASTATFDSGAWQALAAATALLAAAINNASSTTTSVG